ncbi:MAG: DUF202 domain-containing protein [Rhizomicrobium sp.]
MLAFSCGLVMSGTVVNHIVHDRATLLSYRFVIAGFVALMIALFAGPLIVFCLRLLDARRRGILEYGALARSVGAKMERKWFRARENAGEDALAAPDFSATTDLYSIVANAYAMNIFPVAWVSLALLVAGRALAVPAGAAAVRFARGAVQQADLPLPVSTATMTVGAEQDRFSAPPTVSNHFAWVRTRLGIERTFMAWLRTSVSLIGFGFTIVQFFERLQDMDSAKRILHPEAPRDLGLALIATGVGALLISMWQYRQMLRYLWRDEFRDIAGLDKAPHRTPVFAAALVIVLIGVFAFATVFFRLM